MPNQVFIAINCVALYSKSKVYVSRALSRKTAKDFDEYQLWASLALELLGKAALATRHPSLVVDPMHWQSMFVAAGINVTTDVKTITAKTLFERLKHLIPRFDQTVQKFCLDIAERRNAELHSADLPFRTMRLEVWEARYWHACDTILHDIGFSLEDWLGAADAKAPRRIVDEAANALAAAVKLRVEAASRAFQALKKAEREQLLAEAELRDPLLQTALFKGQCDDIWAEICPACKCRAFMTGEQIREDLIEDGGDEYGAWETVEREFMGEQFRCPSCELSLNGNDEIVAAGLDETHTEEQERELGYEPDYGND